LGGEGQLCETNPIRRFRIADWGLRIGDRSATEGPLPRAAAAPDGRMCKTNPICPAVPGGPASHLRPQAPPKAVVRNEANSRRGRLGRALGDEGRRCKTKPISGRRPVEYPAFHFSIIPPFQSDADCVRQSQSATGRDALLPLCVHFFPDLKMSPPPAKLLTPLGRYGIEDSGHVDTWHARDETCVWTEGAVQLCDVEEGSPNALAGVWKGAPRCCVCSGDPDPGTPCDG